MNEKLYESEEEMKADGYRLGADGQWYKPDNFIPTATTQKPTPDRGRIAIVVDNELSPQGRAMTATRKAVKAQGGNKYHVAEKEDRTYNGIVYHSKKEAEQAAELDLLVKYGEKDFWLRQVPFIVGYDPLTVYVADFVAFARYPKTKIILHPVWDIEVIEVKPWYKETKKRKAGFYFTPESKRKIKLFRENYPNLKLKVV